MMISKVNQSLNFDFHLVMPPKALNTKWTTWQDVNSKSFLSSLRCSEGGINGELCERVFLLWQMHPNLLPFRQTSTHPRA